MDATRAQRTVRATVLIGLGLIGLLVLSGDPRAALAHAGFLAVAVPAIAWTVIENLVLKQDEPAAYRGKLTTRLAQAGVILGMYVSAFDAFRLPDGVLPRAWWMAAAGAVVIALGGAVRILAIRTLDRHFRYELRVADEQGLVTSGVYRFVRHPSYLGLVLITLGAGVAFASAWGILLGTGFIVTVLVARIRDEEHVLAAAFGPAYEAYRTRSWRLVPPIY